MFPLCATSNLSTFSDFLFSFTHAFFSPLVVIPPSIPTNAFPPSHFLDPFSSSLLLFRFLIIHLLLSFPAPWGKQIPLSQARTINQSLVSHMFFLSQLFTFPLHHFARLFFAFIILFTHDSVHHLRFYGLICYPLSFSPSTALFDPLNYSFFITQ